MLNGCLSSLVSEWQAVTYAPLPTQVFDATPWLYPWLCTEFHGFAQLNKIDQYVHVHDSVHQNNIVCCQ